MSKPEDIPQDVWHRAEIAVLGKIYGGQITQAQEFRVEVVAVEIMAVISEERDACAKIAGNFLMTKTSIPVTTIVECEEAIRVSR